MKLRHEMEGQANRSECHSAFVVCHYTKYDYILCVIITNG